MSRAYDAKLVALTIGTSFKWIDNLLSHHDLPGVTRGRQGVRRRINDEGLIAIEVVRLLTVELGIAIGRAVEIARGAPRERAVEFRVVTHPDVALTLRLAEIERRVRVQLVGASEAVARVRRGRPRRSPPTEADA